MSLPVKIFTKHLDNNMYLLIIKNRIKYQNSRPKLSELIIVNLLATQLTREIKSHSRLKILRCSLISKTWIFSHISPVYLNFNSSHNADFKKVTLKHKFNWCKKHLVGGWQINCLKMSFLWVDIHPNVEDKIVSINTFT